MEYVDQKIYQTKDELISLRRELHRIPEVGFQEYRTAARVAEYLSNLGIEVTEGIGGTGVIGLLSGTRPGPTIALRACLDALAMDEGSGVEYASENPGAFHGCGHDGNMTFVLGAANILSGLQDDLKGNVKFIFQPSEEETGGAAEVIQAGGLRNPEVDGIITLHNWHGLKQGVLAVVPGPVLASSDLFRIEIIGVPGHGAWPHLAVDPVVIAAEVISAIQNIVSREINPLSSAVITIGKIYGGTAVNVIPETVTLEGTVRAFDPEIREYIQSRIEQILESVTRAARASHRLTYNVVMPPANNDRQLSERAYQILSNTFEPGMVINDFKPGMGCEEFSLFQQKVPGLFLFIGNDREGSGVVPIHSPQYVFNDEILSVGVKALCEIAINYLKV